MATVRIYKVAELLGMTSQEVLQLLKRNHGIELKSASSPLEEIVARQFVERQARQRNIELPKGDIFSESAIKAAKAKTASTKKGQAPEPPKPTGPPLPPPRLVRSPRQTPANSETPSHPPEPATGTVARPAERVNQPPPTNQQPLPSSTQPTDFEVSFSPSFRPDDVRSLLTALADYYRACGGIGLEIQFEFEDVNVHEHSHV